MVDFNKLREEQKRREQAAAELKSKNKASGLPEDAPACYGTFKVGEFAPTLPDKAGSACKVCRYRSVPATASTAPGSCPMQTKKWLASAKLEVGTLKPLCTVANVQKLRANGMPIDKIAATFWKDVRWVENTLATGSGAPKEHKKVAATFEEIKAERRAASKWARAVEQPSGHVLAGSDSLNAPARPGDTMSCPTCDGSLIVPGSHGKIPCTRCNGTGRVPLTVLKSARDLDKEREEAKRPPPPPTRAFGSITYTLICDNPSCPTKEWDSTDPNSRCPGCGRKAGKATR